VANLLQGETGWQSTVEKFMLKKLQLAIGKEFMLNLLAIIHNSLDELNASVHLQTPARQHAGIVAPSPLTVYFFQHTL
jgi:hypothetical protein